MRKTLLLVAILLAFIGVQFVAPSPVRAATIEVDTLVDEPIGTTPGTCTLREAIQAANTDTVVSGCDPGSGADSIEFTVSGTITLTGNISVITEVVIEGAGNIILDGGGSTNIFTLGSSNSDLTLNDITLQNGSTAGGGGAILVSATDASLTINNSLFQNNTADGNGGAISSNGTLIITDTRFTNNSAGGDGGAIYEIGASSMTITASMFDDNTAGTNPANTNGSGGAIYHSGGVLQPSAITATYFVDNRVENADSFDGGGAIFHNAGVLAITASAFSGNVADGDDAYGGAIFNNSTDPGGMAISYSHFGDPVGTLFPQLPLFGIDITSPNRVTGTATGGGGAIFSRGSLLVTGSSFMRNSSSNHGGALFNNASVTQATAFANRVIIANSTFYQNTATADGGAIYHIIPPFSDRLIELINVTIAENSAGNGGGIYNSGDGESPDLSINDEVRLTNSILASNTPDNCAGGSIGNGVIGASGGNVVFGGACNILQQDGSSTAATPILTDPNLGTPELAFSFATILTIVLPLDTGSSALGVGIQTVCDAIPVINLDQRGFIRPAGDPDCDAGAYESALTSPSDPEINVRDGADTTDIAHNDLTPDPTDGTDFGTISIGNPVSSTFIIENNGNGDLIITLPIGVPAGFTVTLDPTTPVPANDFTIFTVQCNATARGTFSGNVVINSNDPLIPAYTFAIECVVEAPEMVVTGLTNTINNGDAPSVVTGTNFGSVAQGDPSVARSFVVENIGELNLGVTNVTVVPITGYTTSFPTSFTLIQFDTESLDIECDTTTAGVFTSTVTITSNDPAFPVFTFQITCEVTAVDPLIRVEGNGIEILNGMGPDPADDTDFGQTPVSVNIARTFTIINTGSADLDINNVSVTGDFNISATPSTPVGFPMGSTTFEVECDATTDGIKNGVVTIDSNAANHLTFTFNVRCEVVTPEANINVQGNGIDIPGDLSNVPDTLDHTIFVATTQGTPVTRTYTILNIGTAPLSITSTSVTGDFSIFTPPVSPVAVSGNTTFVVQCDATVVGTNLGVVTIVSGAVNVPTYEFNIECEVDPAEPDIAVSKTVDNPTPVEGATIVYSINIQNIGIANATNIVILDVLPSGVTYVSDNAGSVLDSLGNATAYNSGTGAWTIGQLNISGNITLQITATVDAGASLLPQPITNTASLDSLDQTDSNSANDSDDADITVSAAEPDIAVSKTVDNPTPVEGATIVYSVNIQNIGTANATNIVILDVLPSGVTYVSDNAGSVLDSLGNATAYNSGTGAWTIGQLNISGNITLQITATVDAGASLLPQPITNTASLDSLDQTDSNSANDSDDADITVGLPQPDIAVSKTVDNPTPVEGATIVYSVNIQNIGTANATNIVILDVLPSGVTYFADNAGSVLDSLGNATAYNSGTGEWTIGQLNISGNITLQITATVDAGASLLPQPITNTASLDSLDQTDSNSANDSDDADITVGLPQPDIAVTKTVNNPTPTEGATIVYSVNIQNIGTATATNIIIVDQLPAGVSYVSDNAGSVFDSASNPTAYNSVTGEWTIGQLDVMGNITLQITATVDAGASLLPQPITNAASLDALDQTDGNPANDDDTADITVGAAEPEINVQGNGVDIANNDATPDLADHTDFGTTPVGVDVLRTFTIQNLGTATLTITSVDIDPPMGTPFSVTTAPAGTVDPSDETTFVVTCDAGTIGTFNAVVEIISDDADENPYRFAVRCQVSVDAPEMQVFGNSLLITNGATPPIAANHTDFGTTTVGIPLTRTFTINNIGTLNLTISPPVVPAGFTVITPPAANVPAGGSTTFTIQCDHPVFAAPHTGFVSITNNDTPRNPYTFEIRCSATAAPEADLSLSKTVSNNAPQVGETITYFITVSNVGPGSTENVTVQDYLPPTVTYVPGSSVVSQGSFDEGTFLWTVGTMGNPSTQTLQFDVVVNGDPGITVNFAEVMTSSAPDPNSTPGNGTPPNPVEDDEAAIAFLFDPPFGRKSFVEDGVNVLEWTVIWVNPSNNPIAVTMNDPLLGGTTFVSGSLTCTTFGASTTTTCQHNPITNAIEFTGVIAPDLGVTLATIASAPNRLQIVYRVVVPDGVTVVPNVSTLTDTDSDNVFTATETYTRTITPPPPTPGTPPLTTEEIKAQVTALPATGETPWWRDVLIIAGGLLVVVGGTLIIGRKQLKRE